MPHAAFPVGSELRECYNEHCADTMFQLIDRGISREPVGRT